MSGRYPCPRCETVASSAHHLRAHLMGARRGHQMTGSEADQVIAEIESREAASSAGTAESVSREAGRPEPEEAPPLRPGHRRALGYLSDAAAYHETRALYRSICGRDVYLRPTDGSFTVVSIDFEGDAAMVGVGNDGSEHLSALPPSVEHVEAALLGFRTKLSTGNRRRSSAEERYALFLVAHALAGDLELPGFPGVYFVHQEWRFPEVGKLDLLGIEPAASRLVVIELKGSESKAKRVDRVKGGDAWSQAEAYADALVEHRHVLYPYFQDLARVMARLHGAPASVVNAELDLERRPRTEVSWPSAVMPSGGAI